MKLNLKTLSMIPEDNLDLIFSYLPSYILQRDIMTLSKYFFNFVISIVQERRKNNLFNFSIHRTCFLYELPKKHQIQNIQIVFPNYLLVYSIVEDFYVLLIFDLTENSKIFERKYQSPIESKALSGLIEGAEGLFQDVNPSFIVNQVDNNFVNLENGFYLENVARRVGKHVKMFFYLKNENGKQLDVIERIGLNPWLIQQSPHQNNQFLLIFVSDWVLFEIKNSKLEALKTKRKYFKLISQKDEMFLFHENGIDFYDKETFSFEEFFQFDCSIHEICEMDEQFLAISSYDQIIIFDIFNTEVVSKIKTKNGGKISKISSFGGYLICNSFEKKNELSIFEFDTL
jgi:hypothetical protein